MTRALTVDAADVMPDSEPWSSTSLTDRLLDVLLDTRGVCAAFIVNDFGELLGVRFAPGGPPRSAFAGALEAAAGLRVAASSGLETTTVVVEFPLGYLFARRFRRSHLCVWSKEALAPRALEMSSRLVAASLPPDARMDAEPAAHWDEGDQRPTEPCPPVGDWAAPEDTEVSLRAPALPRDLLEAERDDRQPPRPASGIRAITLRGLPDARIHSRR